MNLLALASFLSFTLAVAALTWWFTRGDDHRTETGYFLAGRSLTWPLIAGSLLLTNLSTEQLVGLNGSAYVNGLAVMAWEVVAVVTLVAMALFFLPRYLRHGIATVPEYLALRFDTQTRLIADIAFLAAYAVILLPIILYTGATGLIGILNIDGSADAVSPGTVLWVVVWTVGVIGSVYALFGGLRTVAVSDLFNGIGLLVGGLLVSWFALRELGDGQVIAGLRAVAAVNGDRMSSIGGAENAVPFETVFTGVLLLNLFYWTTNQQIIQRTLGANSLAEGQKGVLATGLLKLLGPLYLVLPGLVAYAMYPEGGLPADHAYGEVVREVLPAFLTGFFAAVLVGAVLSSYNSALNSACTIFALGIFDRFYGSSGSVRAAKIFGLIVALVSMSLAPFLANQPSIFAYLQKMNGIYFIPILAVVVAGMLLRNVPAAAAKIAMLGGIATIAAGYFFAPFARLVESMHEFHFLGIVFLVLLVFMRTAAAIYPAHPDRVERESGFVDMTPWRHAWPVSAVLLFCVVAIYLLFI